MSYVLACIIVAVSGPFLFSGFSALVGPVGTIIAYGTLGVTVWLLIDLVHLFLTRVGALAGSRPTSVRRDDALPKPESYRDNAPILNERDAESFQNALRILKRPRAYRRRWGQAPPQAVVVRGHEGSGRALLAKRLARRLGKTRTYRVDTSTHEGPWSDATFVRDTYRAAGRRSVVVVDHGFVTNDHVAQALAEEVCNSRALTVFIADGKKLHPVLHGLSHVTVDLTEPEKGTREALFRWFTRSYRKRLDCELEPLVAGSLGLYGGDIAKVCRLAVQSAANKGGESVTYRDFDRAFKQLGRELPPSASADAIYRVDCFACGGGDGACPVCKGSGWTRVVKRHQAA